MIEVLSAYRFLRRMEVGQFLFMWEIATKLQNFLKICIWVCCL